MENLPVMMYLHGFMSGANGAKQRQLQKQYKGRYRVIAPELTANPDESLSIINKIIDKECPEIIIGSSLGGWMALESIAYNADIILVNPCLTPQTQISRWLNEEQKYFCKRLDGVQTYTLTQEILDLYNKYNAFDSIDFSKYHISALCSTADELLGDSHCKALRNLLPDGYYVEVDDFGHQCRDAGMTHLFELIDKVIARRQLIAESTMTFEKFKDMVRNRPVPDTLGCYRLTIICANDKLEKSALYPTFDEAYKAMHGIEKNGASQNFIIEHLGYGQIDSILFPVKVWMYDADFKLIQQQNYSSFHYHQPGIYGKFFGHLQDEVPYHNGDIVAIRNSTKGRLPAIVVGEPWDITHGYEEYCSTVSLCIRKGKSPSDWVNEQRFSGCDDDEYFLQYGPYDEMMRNFTFAHPMQILPAPSNISKEEKDLLMQWYMDYLASDECN